MSICCLLLYEVILPSEAPLHFAPVTVRLVTTTFDCLSLLLLLLLTLCCPVNESCEQIMVHPQTIFFFNGKMSLKTKLNEKKKNKKSTSLRGGRVKPPVVFNELLFYISFVQGR